jgi:peptidylprolyl isomerase
MARNNEPDTGSTDFYIVIGQAPRYLDRNLTIFGRVIDGMEVVQRILRGPTEANGMIPEGAPRTEIVDATLAESLPPAELGVVEVEDTNSAAFAAVLESRRVRGLPFFHHKPPEVLDVCQVPVATRRLPLPAAAGADDAPAPPDAAPANASDAQGGGGADDRGEGAVSGATDEAGEDTP